MKKTLTIILLSLSAIIMLDSLNAGHAFVMFFLAGVVPGTNISIDAAHMLQIFTLLIGFTLSRITLAIMHAGLPARRTPRAAARISRAQA